MKRIYIEIGQVKSFIKRFSESLDGGNNRIPEKMSSLLFTMRQVHRGKISLTKVALLTLYNLSP